MIKFYNSIQGQKWFFISLLFFLFTNAQAQVVINEGSNRNYSALSDEDGEYPDWIEIYNSGIDTVSLLDYSLTDELLIPQKWIFPAVRINPGAYRTIFCSGKNRKPAVDHYEFPLTTNDTFKYIIPDVLTAATWNSVAFNDSAWTTATGTIGYGDNDDTVVVAAGTESIFLRYNMNIIDTGNIDLIAMVMDYDDAFIVYLNGTEISRSTNITNSGWNALADGTHEAAMYLGGSAEVFIPDMQLVRAIWHDRINLIAIELHNTSSGSSDLSLATFVIAGIKNASYSYPPPPAWFTGSAAAVNLHTNFKISGTGEAVYLFSPAQLQLSSLYVHCSGLDNSFGSFPDASIDTVLFASGTPAATNNFSIPYSSYAVAPIFSLPSAIYTNSISVTITNPNTDTNSVVYYTLNGSDPDSTSNLDDGNPIAISQSTIMKARAYSPGLLQSAISVSSYFMNVSHATPVLSVVTDSLNLYGASGIFDNYNMDWEKPAYVEYFDSTQNLIFSKAAGMMIDGGAGGSRSHPQHSFKVKMGDDVLGGGTVDYIAIPSRPNRNKYSTFYLRNGSNQYLELPYKDAMQVNGMCDETNCYYSAWRPITVYVNGKYFGLYELREKFDSEYFKEHDDADPDNTEILSLSYFYGSVLRAIEGNVDSFWNSYSAFQNLDNTDTAYWNNADQIFDMHYYNDYIISESWMGNVDWPQNNIKLYRSDATNHRWRFCTLDLELSISPNSWTDCYYDHVAYMMNQSPGNPYINIWLRGLLNDRFRNYFINRFADVMNTAYDINRISAIENNMYNQTLGEMENEFTRWTQTGIVALDMANFTQNHNTFQTQLAERTTVVRDNIQADFVLPRQVDLTLDVYPAGAGKIHISTITPNSYPWHGIYFDGLPVKIEAIPNPGFHFLHWGNNILLYDSLNIVFNDTLQCDTINFTAWFEEDFNSAQGLTSTENEISIYPSPAIDNLFIVSRKGKSFSGSSLQIIDLNGRVVIEKNISIESPSISIDISALTSSVYLLRLFDSAGIEKQFRFVKMKTD